MSKRRVWLAVTLAALSSTTGCSTTGSYWPSGWFGSKPAPSANLAQYNARNAPPSNPSRQGANAQLGAPAAAAATGPFSAMTASFKSWGGSSDPAPADDPLSLDSQPKQLSPELYVQMARMHEAKGDFAGAIRQYELALKASPNNTDILVGLGRAYDRKGDMAKAMESYQLALKIDPRCALAHNDLGLCIARQNDLPRARESLSKAVALAPTSKLYRSNLATVLVVSRQYNEAYDQFAAVYPPAIAQYNVGVLANRYGNKVEAMSRFQQSASLDANLVQARTMIDKLNGVPAAAVETSVADQRGPYPQRTAAGRTQLVDRFQPLGQGVATTVSGTTNGPAPASPVVEQPSAAAQAAILAAEAKIRGATSRQVAPIEPRYTSGWVPPPSDDITPIEDPADAAPEEEDEGYYSISDDEDEVPVLLPPTNE